MKRISQFFRRLFLDEYDLPPEINHSIKTFEENFPGEINRDLRESLRHILININVKQKRYYIDGLRLIEIGFNDQITVSSPLSKEFRDHLISLLKYLNGELEETDKALFRHSIAFGKNNHVVHNRHMIYEKRN